MRVLVTGANGLVGKKIAQQLSKNGNLEVYATSLKKINLDGITAFTSNLLNANINQMVEDIKPDALIHCAALSSPDACDVDRFAAKRMNVELTQRIVSACEDYHVRLVFLSTDFVFDGQKGSYIEDDTANPINYYGESKLEAEKIIHKANIPSAIIRTSLVYGYEQKLSRPNILTQVIEYLGKNQTYKVPTDQIRTPTYAKDLAIAIEQICLNDVNGLFHVSCDEVISVADFAKTIATTFGFSTDLLQSIKSSELPQAALRPKNTSLVIKKIKDAINYTPTPIELALRQIKTNHNL